jgi:mannose-1-phosphate guanylyltransferase
MSNLNLTKMLQQFNKTKVNIMLYLTIVENPKAYGLVKLNSEGTVETFTEKPKTVPKNLTPLVNAGCYIMRRKMIEKFFHEGAYSIEKDIFPEMLKQGETIHPHVTEDLWFDVGSPEKYLHTNIAAAENKIEGLTFTPENHNIIINETGTTITHKNSTIHPTAKLVNTYVGEGTKIGENVNIHNSWVSRNSLINKNTTIFDSIIGEGVFIGEDNEIPSGARIGNHARLENQTIRFNTLK